MNIRLKSYYVAGVEDFTADGCELIRTCDHEHKTIGAAAKCLRLHFCRIDLCEDGRVRPSINREWVCGSVFEIDKHNCARPARPPRSGRDAYQRVIGAAVKAAFAYTGKTTNTGLNHEDSY